MSTRPQGNSAYTPKELASLAVQAGKMASFTVVGAEKSISCVVVSLRTAVWLLQSLEGKIEAHDRQAVAKGEVVRVVYQYGWHEAVLGNYSVYEIDGFLFGLLAYTRRKYRDTDRRAKRMERAQAQAKKGGLAL